MPVKTLKCGIQYNKATPWKRNNLKGEWVATIKIDGVRVFRAETPEGWLWVSRASKPLYNLDHLADQYPIGSSFEVYRSNWETSTSLVRTQLEDTGVTASDLYRIDPDNIDPRLFIGVLNNPTVEELEELLQTYRDLGYEGLILYQGSKVLKVKPKERADVYVTGAEVGTGKFEGMLGYLTTNYGDVGTGFTPEQRAKIWAAITGEPVTWSYVAKVTKIVDGKKKKVSVTKYVTEQPDPVNNLITQLIEVSFMEWTPAGKFRHPAFERERFDKTEESLPGHPGTTAEE